MDISLIITSVFLPLILGYLAYNEKDKSSMKQRLHKTLCKQEVEHLIDLKLEVVHLQHSELKDDLERLETMMHILDSKIDKLIEKL
jgi:hypothetical protein